AVAGNLRTVLASAMTRHEGTKPVRKGDPLAEQQKHRKASGRWRVKCAAHRHAGLHNPLLATANIMITPSKTSRTSIVARSRILRLQARVPAAPIRSVSWPASLETWKSGTLSRRIERALAVLERCTVCPRDCAVNRLADEKAVCKVGRRAKVST